MIRLFITIIFSTVITFCVNAQNVDKPVLSNSSTIKSNSNEIEKSSNELPILENSSKKNEKEVSKKTKQKNSNFTVPKIGVANKKNEF
ncbi:MAG: hypothetical protein A3K10_09770 [Bacteroidetes bacterium RIFCSPLOWO2_12_FULL_31_6]|nr:MAG: hypothetical protein A3K10_09770 [Bacteroidetes bacterium RIFCSPLOWO2_12_FULL_31_6]